MQAGLIFGRIAPLARSVYARAARQLKAAVFLAPFARRDYAGRSRGARADLPGAPARGAVSVAHALRA